MSEPKRVSVQEARKRVPSGGALLVCAYPTDKWKRVNMEGSISIDDLPMRLAKVSKDAEIIFY